MIITRGLKQIRKQLVMGVGEGLGKSKTNIRAQRTKSHEKAMRTIKKIGAELGHPRNIFERDRKPPPPPPNPFIPWIN